MSASPLLSASKAGDAKAVVAYLEAASNDSLKEVSSSRRRPAGREPCFYGEKRETETVSASARVSDHTRGGRASSCEQKLASVVNCRL